MTDKLRESLSALMDDEADELEMRRLLKALPEDKELQEAWKRYHLIRAGIRKEMHTRPCVDLVSSVHEAIESEPVPSAPRRVTGAFGTFARYFGQSAIAASVAVAVLLAAERFNAPGGPVESAGSGDDGLSVVNTTGEFEPSELTRTANFTGGDNGALDDEARDRLRRAVYREFEQNSRLFEVPVNNPLPPRQSPQSPQFPQQ